MHYALFRASGANDRGRSARRAQAAGAAVAVAEALNRLSYDDIRRSRAAMVPGMLVDQFTEWQEVARYRWRGHGAERRQTC